MGETTGISWTDATWNPWQGCSKVALGCVHCYMFREKKMYGQDPTKVIRSKPPTFNLPLSKTKIPAGAKVFVCSWSDFFHEAADPWRDEAWAIIARRPDVTFIVPTKRLANVAARTPWILEQRAPWRNVWLLGSCATQADLDAIAALLLVMPYAVRGLSLEPLLSGMNLARYLGVPLPTPWPFRIPVDSWIQPRGFDWVIVAGESGGPHERRLVYPHSNDGETLAGYRPKPDALTWVREIRDQCQAAKVPFHLKGWGGPRPTSGGAELDGREWREFPTS